MLRIKILGPALVAVFMMGAVAASSAMAAHQWLINGSPIASRLKVHALLLLLFADTKATGGEVEIHCHASADGYVGPGNLDLILAITKELLGTNDKIPCTFDKTGACKSGTTPVGLVVDLPWLSLITLINGHVRDLIEKDPSANVSGNPGWKVTCTNILGGETTDECTATELSTGLTNVAAGVEAIFDAESPKLNCTIGGAGAGLVGGTMTVFSPSGTEKVTFE